jgi:hypothetical protein
MTKRTIKDKRYFDMTTKHTGKSKEKLENLKDIFFTPACLTLAILPTAAIVGILWATTGGSTGGPSVGDEMPDRTVYAGLSPATGSRMYATPEDARRTYTWDSAVEYCEGLLAHGYDDWRLPTQGQLAILYNARASIGNFDTSGIIPQGWYWSSTEDLGIGDTAYAQSFRDEQEPVRGGFVSKHYGKLSVRCVRTDAQEQDADMRLRQMMTIVAPAAGP